MELGLGLGLGFRFGLTHLAVSALGLRELLAQRDELGVRLS